MPHDTRTLMDDTLGELNAAYEFEGEEVTRITSVELVIAGTGIELIHLLNTAQLRKIEKHICYYDFEIK